jgi:hypothetical protein
MPRLPEALGTPQDFSDDAGQGVDQIQDVQDRLSRAAAEQDFISKKLDLDQQFAGDTDYATAPQRYRQALLGALNDTSQGILGPVQRADFQQQMSRFTEAGVDSILRQSVAKARDAGRANVTQASGVAVSDALRTTDETNLNPIFNALNDRIQASLEAGYLSPEEAVALRKGTAQSYVSQRGWRLADADPQQAVDTLSPTETSADGAPVFAKFGDWRDLLDPGERQSMVQRSQQNLQMQQRAAGIDALRQQRRQQKADADAAQATAARYVDQLATDPTSVDIGALARERFPDSQQDTRQALIGAAQTAVAQAGDKTATGYGPGFWQAFERVTAADGDPAKITDPAELYKLAGPDSGGALTMTGVQQLQRFLDQNKTVEGRAQSAMEQNFLRQAHAAITGTEDDADPAAEARFQNFLGAYFPALDTGLNSGKSAMQLLSAAGSDYLGKLIPAFTPPAAQSAADQRGQTGLATQTVPTGPAATLIAASATTPVPNAASLSTDAMRAWVKDWPVPPSGPSMIGFAQSVVRGFADLLDYSAGGLEPVQNLSPDAINALSFFATKTPAGGSGKLIAAAAEAKTVGDAQRILGQASPQELEALARQSAKDAGAPPPPDAQTAGEAGTPGEHAAPGVTGEAGAAPPSDTTPAPQGNTAAAAGLSWVSRVPSPEEVRAITQATDRTAAEALIDKLRSIVQLPEYDKLKETTSAVLLTDDGRVIKLESGPPDPRYGLPAGKHAEGKAAIWMRDNGVAGGIVFHNHPGNVLRLQFKS